MVYHSTGNGSKNNLFAAEKLNNSYRTESNFLISSTNLLQCELIFPPWVNLNFKTVQKVSVSQKDPGDNGIMTELNNLHALQL